MHCYKNMFDVLAFWLGSDPKNVQYREFYSSEHILFFMFRGANIKREQSLFIEPAMRNLK